MNHDQTPDPPGEATPDPLQIYDDPAPMQPTTDEAAATVPTERSGSRSGVIFFAGIALVAVLVMQIVLLVQGTQTRNDVDALSNDVEALAGDVDDVENSLAAAGTTASPAPVAESLPDGALPPFDPNQPNDAALGLQLGTVSGTEYYSATAASIDPADDTPRVWLIWAHWCPHCQNELPAVSEWYEARAADYPDIELVTISTAIDPSRDNPLEPYLEESQFPFPVLVDENTTIAAQIGASAFPFWMVTDGEGTVLVRIPGAIGIETVEQIFTSLDEMASA